MKWHKGTIILLLSFIIFTACGSKSNTALQTLPKPQANKQISKESEKLNRKIIEETFSDSSTVDYQIGPGDLLNVKVMQAPELDSQARVNSQSSISLPLLGSIEVAGLTAVGAQQRISDLLSEKYMHDPHVVVSIAEYKSKRVAVIGSVQTPGTYELLGKGSLLDALAQAGGLAEDASEIAYVTRKDKAGNEKSVEIDLDLLLDKGQSDLNIPIHMGDVVYIPEAGVVYVDGAVENPGSFPLEDDMTVSQAIAAAGGFDDVASASDIKLVRNVNGQIQLTPINMELIHEGTELDIELQDQDVVVVGASGFKSFLDAIKFGLYFPPFSMGVR
jgi:polysaccharide biosynthesis/export protein